MGGAGLLGMMAAVTISMPGLIGLLVIFLTRRLSVASWGVIFIGLVVARGVLAAILANRMFVRDVQAFAVTVAVLYALALLAFMFVIVGARYLFARRASEGEHGDGAVLERSRQWVGRNQPKTIGGVFALIVGVIFVWEIFAPRSLNLTFDWLTGLLGKIVVVAVVGSIIYLAVYYFRRGVDGPEEHRGDRQEPPTASLWPPDTPLDQRVPPPGGRNDPPPGR